ncbi:MAG: hypothetical protein PHF86_03200 [Candidatus Nanoarchaeia archaeon]|jgi:hypothetical protein|nr:hypothetical protein [Candidatus Nanoarchaeia archaeon]
MNNLIIGSSITWIVGMCFLLKSIDTPIVKLFSFIIIIINLCSSIYYLKTNSFKKTLELRSYTDNIAVILLTIMFPSFFYGYHIQLLLSVIVNYFYLKSKHHIYKILIFLTLIETICYFVITYMQKMMFEVVFNCLTTLFLAFVLFIIKDKLLINSEIKYKKIIDNVNEIFKHQITNTITPMYYYIDKLNEPNRTKMICLVDKLKNIAQSKNTNFGKIITLVKSSILYTSGKNINITLVDQVNKNIDVDSFYLLLIIYVLFDCSINSNSTEIIVKFNNTKIDIIDNGIIHKKCFYFESAKELLDLLNIPSKILSSHNGTKITLDLRNCI